MSHSAWLWVMSHNIWVVQMSHLIWVISCKLVNSYESTIESYEWVQMSQFSHLRHVAHKWVIAVPRHSLCHVAHSLLSHLRHVTAEPQGSQGTQTRGMWDVCITKGCSSFKRQTLYIGPVEVVTDPFFLEGVLYTKLTSHVSISVFTRMIFAWHQKWSGRSRPCLVYRRDGYRIAVTHKSLLSNYLFWIYACRWSLTFASCRT